MSNNIKNVLEVKNLKTSFYTHLGEVQSVRGVDFNLKKGEILGIVGESGSGKSVTSMSVMKLLQQPGKIKDGEIFVPKLKSFKIIDLANSISKKNKIIGLRYGEKMNELLITDQEKRIAKETKEMWIIKQHTK